MKKMVMLIVVVMMLVGATGCATPKAVATDVKDTAEAVKDLTVSAAGTVKGAVCGTVDKITDATDKVIPKRIDLNGNKVWKKGEDRKGL